MMVADALWGAHEQARTAPAHSSVAAPGGTGAAPALEEIAAQITALISPLVTAMRRWPEPSIWVAREILFGADMPHRQQVLDHVERLEEQIAARLRDGRADAFGAVEAAGDGAEAAAATGARLIVTGVLAELNRSRQGRIDGENVDVALQRLIDLVVAGACAAR